MKLPNLSRLARTPIVGTGFGLVMEAGIADGVAAGPPDWDPPDIEGPPPTGAWPGGWGRAGVEPPPPVLLAVDPQPAVIELCDVLAPEQPQGARPAGGASSAVRSLAKRAGPSNPIRRPVPGRPTDWRRTTPVPAFPPREAAAAGQPTMPSPTLARRGSDGNGEKPGRLRLAMAVFLLAAFLLGGVLGFAGRPPMPLHYDDGETAPL
jgi:hypothetical protein